MASGATAVGSRLSWAPTRNSRVSVTSGVTNTAELTRPPLAHVNSRSSRRVVSVYQGRPLSGSEMREIQLPELERSDTIDFA